MDEDLVTFKSLGVADEICKICANIGWQYPTPIQKEVIPLALNNKDIIGIAETGSGKTAAFAIPIVQALMAKPTGLFALVLVPTRELAQQVSEQFEALGASIKLKSAVIVGGQEAPEQRLLLAKRPHVVVATPGRIADHLANMKGFSLRSLKYLVLDEADRMLNADFEDEVNQILKQMPKDHRSYLFSATLSCKVENVKKIVLHDPATVEIKSEKMKVESLTEHLIICDVDEKDVYFCYLLSTLGDKTVIVFCDTRTKARLIWLMLNFLYDSDRALLLHGGMTQDQRNAALDKFKNRESTILVCTDVCSRGIDIPHVDVVVNLDMPKTPESYTHRVGRTARAGRSGAAYLIATGYDIEMVQEIERNREKIPTIEFGKKALFKLQEKVSEARSTAKTVINDLELNKKKRKGGDDDDCSDDESAGFTKRLKMKNKPNGKK